MDVPMKDPVTVLLPRLALIRRLLLIRRLVLIPRLLLAFGLWVMVSLPATAASPADRPDPAVDPAIAAAIVEKLRAARPDLDYQVLASSPVPGFYQVQIAGGPVLHVVEGG
jgi:hypothetical protein